MRRRTAVLTTMIMLLTLSDVDDVATLATIGGALANLTSVATGVDVGDVGAEPGRRARRSLRAIARRPGLRSVRSHFSVDETVERLTAAIDAAPPSVVFTLDHQANAFRVGLELRPTTLIVFGNPNLVTPLMRRRRTTGIDLPQKFLVYEDADGDVFITWNEPRYVARRHRVRGEGDTLRTIGTALHNLARGRRRTIAAHSRTRARRPRPRRRLAA